MTDSLTLVKQQYERSNKALVQPDVVWELAVHFPNGGHYEGRDDIFSDVFGPLSERYPNWRANVNTLFDAGHAVVATGFYTATSAHTGEHLTAQFVHLWEVTDGLISRFIQYVEPKF